MTNEDSTQFDAAEFRSALATLVTNEPDLPAGTADIETRGRRLVARRRLAGFSAAAVAVVGVTLGAASLGGLGTGPAPTSPVAAPPAAVGGPLDNGGAAGGAQLADGFPIGSAVDAVASALPASVGVGELPTDIGWRDGGRLDVPLVGASGSAVVTIQIVDGSCVTTASPAGTLSAAELDLISSAVCTAWAQAGSPVIVPATPGAEQPELANQ